MSDIFSALSGGIRFPDARINGGGPLPTSLSGPAGINGDPDGRYNFNGELLSGITPYAFGPGRMGSDRNYQQIPHRIQKIVPALFLPYADSAHNNSMMKVSHGVDQGDIAFAINSEKVQAMLFDSVCMRDVKIHNMSIPNSTAFANLATVNYILAGLQRLTTQNDPKFNTWAAMAFHLGYDYKKIPEIDPKPHTLDFIIRLLSTRLLPFGICAGSEHQGGQNETGLAPVQAAANYVTTMTVDGQNRDLVNLWSHINLSAGDTLIFRLKYMPSQHYTLNHYYKGVVRQTFTQPTQCWQLVADKFDMSSSPETDPSCSYDYRVDGYWRIGQTFQHRGKTENDSGGHADDTLYLRGQLLQITFAPMWTCPNGMRKIKAPSEIGLKMLTANSELKRRRVAAGEGVNKWNNKSVRPETLKTTDIHTSVFNSTYNTVTGKNSAGNYFNRRNPNTHMDRHKSLDRGGERNLRNGRSPTSYNPHNEEGSRQTLTHEQMEKYYNIYNIPERDRRYELDFAQTQNPPTVSLQTAQNDPASVIGGKLSFSHDTSNVAHDTVAPTPAVPAPDTTPDPSGDAKKPRARTTKLKVRRCDSAPMDVVVSVIDTLPESK